MYPLHFRQIVIPTCAWPNMPLLCVSYPADAEIVKRPIEWRMKAPIHTPFLVGDPHTPAAGPISQRGGSRMICERTVVVE